MYRTNTPGASGADDRFHYRASDASAATKRPRLVIEYTVPQGKAPSNRFAFANYVAPKALQQSGSLTFTPADDASIRSASPSNNCGSATTLEVDDSPVKHFLLKFDVTGVNGQTISNARIRLYNVDSASQGGKFYRVSDNTWQEETVTWNGAPAADTTLLASLGSVSTNTWYEVDVTSTITGDGMYSFRISDSVGGADYSSKEGANPPQLVITLGGTPVPTNTPGPTPIFSNAAFTYDGDGKRVKSVITTNIGITTTYFVGTYYEVANGVVTKYYGVYGANGATGAQRIAMRTNGTLSYLLGDHLGSTSLTTDAGGQIISELRYKAWGEIRYSSGNTATKYQYTGQYSDSYINLLWYGSRHYDPELGRFIKPDSIVPLASQGVQAWDRYGYVNNNPVRYNDPTGHIACDDTDKDGKCINFTQNLLRKISKNYSKDEAAILRDMLRRGKEVAHHAVDFIVNNDVHIYLDKNMYSGIGAQWRTDGNIYINSTQGNSNFDTLGDLIDSGYYAHVVGLVAHEAKHLEQGGATANTVYGEFEGWKTELEVKKEMFQQVPAYGTTKDVVLNVPLTHDPATLGWIWRAMVAEQGLDYFVWLLPLDSDGMIPAIFAPH